MYSHEPSKYVERDSDCGVSKDIGRVLWSLCDDDAVVRISEFKGGVPYIVEMEDYGGIEYILATSKDLMSLQFAIDEATNGKLAAIYSKEIEKLQRRCDSLEGLLSKNGIEITEE